MASESGRRRRRKRAEIELLVRQFQESGLTQSAFARKVGVHPPAVSRWVRLAAMTPPQASSPRFVPVRIRPAPTDSTQGSADWPELVAPNGWRLRVPPGADPGRLTELLDLLPRC